ncbi:MAG: AbrB/MazE/SpoVT family DNA-binding domain-containing protein [Clostridiales bacterium]|jgi:transcriptional pleiotropic regulator of transition state genes|nr:AbrB/MazE/SpoVT family DNA-binding domain-containing protein [Eubacteriales bacterium]MDH7567116.1 AbrB/MazE/SpoVT family DNA-binding domain-containing protein [Clostridiales bacterium]
MKSTGIVRKVDEMGRIVLPVELRRIFNLNEGDPLEIFVDGNMILLKKYEPTCIFCAQSGHVEEVMGKQVCADCRSELKK